MEREERSAIHQPPIGSAEAQVMVVADGVVALHSRVRQVRVDLASDIEELDRNCWGDSGIRLCCAVAFGQKSG